MNIAIVAPSPVPFVFGGAENLYNALSEFINVETRSHCELFKVPVAEGNFLDLINSYEEFSKLDISYFDKVISTKYPSWMISHESHVCYMLHKLRGLYDTYHFTLEPETFNWAEYGFSGLKASMRSMLESPEKGNAQLKDFFDQIKEISNEKGNQDLLRFPGPFVRELVHFLDAFSLAPNRISKYAAISKNVAHRQDYFPQGVPVSILYPPPRLTGFKCGSDDFLFTVSRLDKPKRIDLLIKAMRLVESDIPLVIGGVGPELESLKELAGGDERIKFVGGLTDTEIKDYYANCLAVLFVPYDEDYGYITIEAMKSGKPVLTTKDAGGPNEFVVNGETGFSTEPVAESIASKIDYMCKNRSEVRAMGRNARKKVESINWSTVVSGLIGENKLSISASTNFHIDSAPSRRDENLKTIVVATTFPIYPPRGGGQSRVYHLYRKLARYFNIKIVSLGPASEPRSEVEVAPGVLEIRIPQSSKHLEAEELISKSVDWIPITDIATSTLYKLTPEYSEALAKAAVDAEGVVACHPYLIDMIREAAPHAKLWFEVQDFEYKLKRSILPNSENAERLLTTVRDVESRCWKSAELAFSCSDQDLIDLAAEYGESNAVKTTIANGVSLEDVPFIAADIRQSLKERLGLEGSKIALFMGSWHEPNLEAVRYIFNIANLFPQTLFIIVGSVGQAFNRFEYPENVIPVGTVDDEEKSVLLGAADVALNPMTSGTGSNLKMFDYFAAGIPVISTPFGARGMIAKPDEHFIMAEIEGFALELTGFLANPGRYGSIAIAARKLVEDNYSWDTLADNLYKKISALV